MTSSIESTFEAAVAAKVIPGAIVVASSTDGKFKYARSFGLRSLKDVVDGTPEQLELDAVLWMGSCTKIMTAIAALQCVERGHFTLDEDVTRLLPELKDIELQVPCNGGGFELVKAKNTITMRRLLNHTSGLSYTKFGKLDLPLLERCLAPLVFEPGKGFMYGTGTDFAGLMVERVTGLTLETYIQQNVAAPLGIKRICFRPPEHPDMLARLPDVSKRILSSGELEYTADKIWPLDFKEDSGGSGAYTTIPEFQRILHSITANDGVLLTSTMVDELFRPDMDPEVVQSVKKTLENETTNNIFGGLPKGTEVSYAMGGMVVLEDLEGRRPKGTLHWGALLNIFFWMDRENGLSGIFGSQVFPAGDTKCLGLFAEFESGVYEAYRSIVEDR
ncbi:beta-lactamase/transpeptidase-like protein [Apodospora peruviana]|uniref:Beta-lactamase/transpeptidase-like protein n=1 Tax=Apodospora peruviana TaxID=516989 RepID=A0AAE0M1N3_9PEZI|nr:beta-lactamase/transpeptidase-like protein [Apodospora peruviana]